MIGGRTTENLRCAVCWAARLAPVLIELFPWNFSNVANSQQHDLGNPPRET